MILSFVAALLLTTAQPAPAEEADAAADVAADAAAADADVAADAAADAEAAGDAVEDATDEAEAPDAPEVCRRRSVQDMFGKVKSVRVCRPKVED